jgi:hypothetical protein
VAIGQLTGVPVVGAGVRVAACARRMSLRARPGGRFVFISAAVKDWPLLVEVLP